MTGETKASKDSKIRKLRDENGTLTARVAELESASKLNSPATLEDSGKLKADIVTLQDLLKVKDTDLATLHDKVTELEDIARGNLRAITFEQYRNLGIGRGFLTEPPTETAELEDPTHPRIPAKVITELLDAAYGVLSIIGEGDLPDNGEFSGAAISDQLRAAVAHLEKYKFPQAKVKDSAPAKAPVEDSKPESGTAPVSDVVAPETAPTTEAAPVAESREAAVSEETEGEKFWRELNEDLHKKE